LVFPRTTGIFFFLSIPISVIVLMIINCIMITDHDLMDNLATIEKPAEILSNA